MPRNGSDSGPMKQRSGDAIRIVVRDDEIAQIDSRFAVRREAHHFPFVAVRSESKNE